MNDGQSTLLETYNIFGISSKIHALKVREYRGFGRLGYKSMGMPKINIMDAGRTKNSVIIYINLQFFFHSAGIIDDTIFKRIISGKGFRVESKEKQVNLSNKQRKFLEKRGS